MSKAQNSPTRSDFLAAFREIKYKSNSDSKGYSNARELQLKVDCRVELLLKRDRIYIALTKQCNTAWRRARSKSGKLNEQRHKLMMDFRLNGATKKNFATLKALIKAYGAY